MHSANHARIIYTHTFTDSSRAFRLDAGSSTRKSALVTEEMRLHEVCCGYAPFPHGESQSLALPGSFGRRPKVLSGLWQPPDHRLKIRRARSSASRSFQSPPQAAPGGSKHELECWISLQAGYRCVQFASRDAVCFGQLRHLSITFSGSSTLSLLALWLRLGASSASIAACRFCENQKALTNKPV